jgi:regulator of sirC expression with transglutaminase-like and TPR domain
MTTQRVRINPSDALAYYDRGIVGVRLGEFQGAIADYSEALRINPNESLRLPEPGVARRDSGDKPGAIQDF